MSCCPCFCGREEPRRGALSLRPGTNARDQYCRRPRHRILDEAETLLIDGRRGPVGVLDVVTDQLRRTSERSTPRHSFRDRGHRGVRAPVGEVRGDSHELSKCEDSTERRRSSLHDRRTLGFRHRQDQAGSFRVAPRELGPRAPKHGAGSSMNIVHRLGHGTEAEDCVRAGTSHANSRAGQRLLQECGADRRTADIRSAHDEDDGRIHVPAHPRELIAVVLAS